MATLHQILAVEGGLDATQRKITEEARDTFAKRADHFIGSHRALAMFAENDQAQNTEEFKELVTTVPEKLDYVGKTVSRYLDVVFDKEATNQYATADLVVNGVVLVEGVPATFLLGLESKLAGLRDMYLAIPTLSPGRAWEPYAERGKHVYVDKHPEVRMKTAKTIRHKVLVEATKEHPAQVEKWYEDVPVGSLTATTWSGMLSPAQKSDMLDRLDTLIRAVKTARMHANTAKVKPHKIGETLFAFVNDGEMRKPRAAGE